MVLLGGIAEKLKEMGVHALGIVATTPERARLYFRYRPPRFPMGADPEVVTHSAYGLPRPPMTPEALEAIQSQRINPTGELPEPLSPFAANDALNQLDAFEATATDRDDMERKGTQLIGQFLIDRDGIVRWVSIEAAEGLAELGKFPSSEQFLDAARSLSRR